MTTEETTFGKGIVWVKGKKEESEIGGEEKGNEEGMGLGDAQPVVSHPEEKFGVLMASIDYTKNRVVEKGNHLISFAVTHLPP